MKAEVIGRIDEISDQQPIGTSFKRVITVRGTDGELVRADIWGENATKFAFDFHGKRKNQLCQVNLEIKQTEKDGRFWTNIRIVGYTFLTTEVAPATAESNDPVFDEAGNLIEGKKPEDPATGTDENGDDLPF